MEFVMKNIWKKIINLGLGFSFALSLGLAINQVQKEATPTYARVGNYSTDANTYYNSITATSGQQLAAQLHDLITSTHKTYTTYDDNGSNGYQKQSDQYYENGTKVNGYIYEFYSGVKWPNGWSANAGSTTGGYNREHCWCQSKSGGKWGESGGGADMHHIRPVENRLNSKRGNNPYGEVTNRESNKVYAKFGTDSTYALGGYLASGTFEPIDAKKGDVARIMLYIYLHYNSYRVNSLFGSFGTTDGSQSGYMSSTLLPLTNIVSASNEKDAQKLLLKWNKNDPVDDIERRRNEQVAIYQGNRNPFIDNSNYAEMIFGDGTTSNDPIVTSLSILPSSFVLDLNGTNSKNLTVTVNALNGASKDVVWSSLDNKVATLSSTGKVTAVGVGKTQIKATSTFDSSKYATCSVTVIDSSTGGGDLPYEESRFTWDLSTANYKNCSTTLINWENDYCLMEVSKGTSGTPTNNYVGGQEGHTSTRFYKNSLFEISPKANYKIDSIEFLATSDSFANAFKNSSWQNATGEISGQKVIVTPTNKNEKISATISATCGFTSVLVKYSTISAPSSNLTDITLDVSNVKKEFNVNDTFNYDGLIVNANYSDGTSKVVTPTSVSSPNMAVAGSKTITVTYEENGISKTASYIIVVITKETSNIMAFANKKFNPGDTIKKTDITVNDNEGNEITDFVFANEGYQFTYEDAPSGGNFGSKIFEDAIATAKGNCSLTVSVYRPKRVDTTGAIDSITASGLGLSGTSYGNYNNKTFTSSVIYSAYCATNSNNSIQINSKKSAGLVSINSTMEIQSISINMAENNTNNIEIFAKNEPYKAVADVYDVAKQGTSIGKTFKTTTIELTEPYKYFGIRSVNGACYIASITVTYKGGDNAKNLASFIMFEDTTNQCQSKFPTAVNYFNNLPKEERAIFMESVDYQISTARTRFEAWATSLGKTITHINDDYQVSNKKVFVLNNKEQEVFLIVIGSFVALSSIIIVIHFTYKKRLKKNK